MDATIVEITANETWHRVKIHGIPLNRYLGRGTHRLDKLQEELESENEGLEIPMAMRWLGRVPDIKERGASGAIRGSSVTFIVRGQPMADRIIKSRIRAVGRHYQVEAFVEARPNSICGACSGWGHGEYNCTFSSTPRCALCAGPHRTDTHRCNVEGYRAGTGQVCTHLIAKCPNCKGPHGARSEQLKCHKKKEAQDKAKGWKGKLKETTTTHPTHSETTLEQPETQTPATQPGDIMERDDGLYASRHATQNGGLQVQPSVDDERAAMEKGLDDFCKRVGSSGERVYSCPFRRDFWNAKMCMVDDCINAPAQAELQASSTPAPAPLSEIAMSDAGHQDDEEEL